MRTYIFFVNSLLFLSGCYLVKSGVEDQAIAASEVSDHSVSLIIKPNQVKLYELSRSVSVTSTNNTSDTLTTGSYYRIEHFNSNG